jgi:hypothetical protein
MAKEIIAGDSLQVGHFTDDFMVIRMDTKCSALHRFTKQKVWLVLVAFTLRDDNRAFRGHFFKIIDAVNHPVGLEPQGQVDPVGWHGFEVSCPIKMGKGVPHATIARNGFFKQVGRELGRALELHVLNPVRDTGEPFDFVPCTDSIPGPGRNERRSMDFFEQHP